MGSDEHGPAYPEPLDIGLDPRCPVCLQDNDWCMQDNCPGRNRLPPHEAAKYREYRCPICNGDKNRYMTCDYPACPDGRDQGPRTYPTREPGPHAVRCVSCLFMSTLLIIALLGALIFACARPAAAFDHGFDKTTPRSKWFAQLTRQDQKPMDDELSRATNQWFGDLKRQDKMPDSCCGEADAYEADIFIKNPKTAIEPWGSYDVTITNGEDEHPWPDGKHRTPIPNGTVVHVPGNQINPPKETKNNPTGHSWLFVATKRDMKNVVTPGTTYCFAPLPEGS